MSTNHNFRRERRAEGVSNRGPSAYQPTALPLGQTGSLYVESMEVGGEGDYIPIATRMTSALRWATMRAILMFHNCKGQSHKTVSRDHNFWRERRAEADSNRGPSAYQPNALRASARRSSFERTREGHRQSDKHWNCFWKATLGKLLRDGVARIWACPSA